ncbi:MAG TPA: geranylgeranylglyceryl/heptaprenylglyceryl phosphate synthase [Paludibacter sp.]|nr:geranylgeranylglyceryl/heptaprenylglyceryl phosphate synthase [Paludibacter sp.]
MRNIYKSILLKRESNQKMLAVLLDPDQCKGSILASTVAELKTSIPDFIFVGGSHTVSSIDSLIEVLKEETTARIVLFPGNASQFSSKAHALLYLSLISGRNPEFLIGQHINSAVSIKKSRVEVIPTGYILVEGGKTSSVEYISNTRPIPREKKEIALSTAIAGELLGMKIIYLEAGSGANAEIPLEMISYVRNGLSLPLIVGGGIKTSEQLLGAFSAGADLVVVGNIFESDPKKISEFVEATRTFAAEVQ